MTNEAISPDHLPPGRLEELCVALGFEPVDPARPARVIAVGAGAQWSTDDRPAVWPPLDLDPAWSVKAMEAAARKAGMRFLRFETQPPVTDQYEWSVQVVTDHPDPSSVPADAAVTIGVGFAKKHPLAQALALLAALDAGELGP